MQGKWKKIAERADQTPSTGDAIKGEPRVEWAYYFILIETFIAPWGGERRGDSYCNLEVQQRRGQVRKRATIDWSAEPVDVIDLHLSPKKPKWAGGILRGAERRILHVALLVACHIDRHSARSPHPPAEEDWQTTTQTRLHVCLIFYLIKFEFVICAQLFGKKKRQRPWLKICQPHEQRGCVFFILFFILGCSSLLVLLELLP